MSDIYCVRCKERTGSSDKELVQSKNGRWRMTAKCANCGMTKSVFVKAPAVKVPAGSTKKKH